jgi:hypothetical protein
MKKQNLQKKIALGMTLVLLGTSLSSCAYVPKAIEHADLQTKIRLTDSIFLDPEVKKQNRTVYIEVTNTSDFQELSKDELKTLIAQKLQTKNYKITEDASLADYIIRVNLKYMDYNKETGAQEGAREGFIAGAAAGASRSDSLGGAIAGAIIGGIIGGVGGTLIGKAIKIENYNGVFDIEIREKLNKTILGKITTKADLGSKTQLETENKIETNWQTYRTQINVAMEKTNLDKAEAAKVIAEKVATSIAELF